MKKLLFLITLTLLIGCSKDDSSLENNQNEELQTRTITGTVMLPANNSIDVESLTVQSITGLSSISNSQYEIQSVSDVVNTLFVIDQSEKVILMGYTYPNQSDYTIDSESTLIALLMNLPLAQTLSTQGKVSFVNQIKQDPNFHDLKIDLESLINQGISPLNTNQTEFALKLISFFEVNANSNGVNKNIVNKKNDQPVTIYQQGREFIFQNPGKTYSSYVGIYKDKQRIETIKLDRVKFVPTSISQILKGILDNYTNGPDVVEVPYTLPSENGEYEIKIRTGKEYSDDGGYEAALALTNNVKDIALDVFLDLLSYENKNLDCAQSITNNFITFLGTADDFQNFNSVQDVLSFTYDRTLAFITTSENIFFGCNPPSTSVTNYLKSIEKKIYWLKWIGIIGHTGNFSIGAYQWFTDKAIVDKCYLVNDNIVTKCGIDLSGTWLKYSNNYGSDGDVSFIERFIFNDDGLTSFYEIDYLDGNGFQGISDYDISLSYFDYGGRFLELVYDDKSSRITQKFHVESLDDTIFMGVVGSNGPTYELHKQ